MSTAGKVLVVLCVLMLGVWAVLLASVDQLNINNNQHLTKMKTDLDKLKVEVKEIEDKADLALVKANEEQVAKARDMRLVVIRLSAAERQLSTTDESLSRVKLQLANYLQALETAKLGLAARQAEKTKNEQEKATVEASVKRLQGENADLTGELLELRSKFLATLKENQETVKKQLEAKKALVRRASLIR